MIDIVNWKKLLNLGYYEFKKKKIITLLICKISYYEFDEMSQIPNWYNCLIGWYESNIKMVGLTRLWIIVCYLKNISLL